MIKFNKHHVIDTETKIKARVHYSVDNRVDGRKCVTLYTKSCLEPLGDVLAAEYVNNSDSMTDYFENGRAVLFEGNRLYLAARERAESLRK